MIIVKFLWNPDPVLFSIGPLSIHYYSLMFAIAFILGWYLMKYFYNAEKIAIKYLDPLLFYMILGTIVGAVFGVGVIAYMEIGVVAVGMSGTWRQFFNGLIILLALIGHRLHGDRVR